MDATAAASAHLYDVQRSAFICMVLYLLPKENRTNQSPPNLTSTRPDTKTKVVIVKRVTTAVGKGSSRGGGGGKQGRGQGPRGGIQKKPSTPGGRGSGGGRGGPRGRGGRGGRGSRPEKKKTKEELDAEMDTYFLKDEKTAAQRLNADLDDYWKQKPAAAEGEEKAAEEAAAGEEEAMAA